MSKKIHVGVVGAGVSGLRCADVLLAQGVKVTILEARDRIGGRFCQSDELGYTVDIGPNWIHTWDSGEVHPIFHLAQQTGTPLHKWNNKQLLFDAAGAALPSETTDRLSTLLWDVIGEAFAYSEAEHKKNGGVDIPAEDSLYDFVSRRAKELLSESEADQELLVQMSEMWGAYVGEPVWRQSLRFAWMEECCGGEEMFVASNYRAIFDVIAKPAQDEAKILLGKRVVSVMTSDDARVSSGQVQVTTTDGEVFSFDEVVMSTPLGWLQKNKAATFQPALPDRLSAAIDHLSFSYLEKVFITFPRAFWISDETQDNFASYTNWLAPAYAADTNPQKWPQEIWNLAAFDKPNRHPTLLFYTYGDCSRHIVDQVYGRSRDEKYRFITDFFRPYYSRLPGYDPTMADCVPKAVLATTWQKDELNGNASYCNFQVGIEAADQDVLAIRSGVPDRRLWFCGEHAAPFEECGTVAGAYLSGQSAAENILAANGLGGDGSGDGDDDK
ncbi:hypothetical protein SEUCBS140593_006590 [Sporothrix eucalyptigena]|uniref:Amine oxidase domain-containing protein n=1 Tax=Sporothrix eucalyptigena TaxID=1812306 RepID=A0ABP0C8K8_9PEZI